MTIIYMEKKSLENIPQYSLEEGFSFSYYKEGDEHAWIDIHLFADKYNEINIEIFRKAFGDNTEELAARQCFITNQNGEKIGTATSWYDTNYQGERWGRVHWVAIKPDYQGRGLAKPLLSEVLNNMKKLGDEKVYLTTRGVRLKAVNLYLKYGFVPVINNNAEKESWLDVSKKLSDYNWKKLLS